MNHSGLLTGVLRKRTTRARPLIQDLRHSKNLEGACLLAKSRTSPKDTLQTFKKCKGIHSTSQVQLSSDVGGHNQPASHKPVAISLDGVMTHIRRPASECPHGLIQKLLRVQNRRVVSPHPPYSPNVSSGRGGVGGRWGGRKRLLSRLKWDRAPRTPAKNPPVTLHKRPVQVQQPPRPRSLVPPLSAEVPRQDNLVQLRATTPPRCRSRHADPRRWPRALAVPR